MPTLNLLFEEIKTPFVPKELNLLFVFQVNCPGCFLYGIPLVNQLFEKYHDNNFDILGLSTAFEDFQLNTVENTLLLLDEQSLVGVTKQQLGNKYQHPILFSVAMDKSISKEEAMTEENIDKICNLNPNYNTITQEEKQSFRNRVKSYLTGLPSISYTFTMNQLPGTPTFILFDKNMKMISGWFGHESIQKISLAIEQYKNQ
ncbi:MAG: hypothetical protein QNJ33_11765 [Crocosphaera sp.]|nr:hypothetical protein [Crocosphaera sp.]